MAKMLDVNTMKGSCVTPKMAGIESNCMHRQERCTGPMLGVYAQPVWRSRAVATGTCTALSCIFSSLQQGKPQVQVAVSLPSKSDPALPGTSLKARGATYSKEDVRQFHYCKRQQQRGGLQVKRPERDE